MALNIKEKKLAKNSLPTIRDVIEAINFERNEVTKAEGIKVVAKKIFGLWQQATIPTLTLQRLIAKITQLYNLYLKSSNSKNSDFLKVINLE